ncbi:MAG: tetratricopeptide repeat protein [Planctomycetota bacterium]
MSALPDFDALWNYQDPSGTEAAFRAILDQSDIALSPAYRAELLTQVARTHSLRGQMDQAHELLAQVATILTTDDPALRCARVRYLLELGRTLNSAGDREASRPLFLEAWHRATELEAEFHAVDALHMLAIVSAPTDQVTWALRALEIARRAQDPRARRWEGPLTNNLAWSYHDRGEFAKALTAFESAYAFWLETGREQPIRVARWSVARALRSLGRAAEALAIQQELLAAGDATGFVHEELGECLLALGRDQEAVPHFARAAEALGQDPGFLRREPDRVDRLRRLGGVSG